MQLPSKMRFVSAQLLALYRDDLWLRNASHANGMARQLAEHLRAIDGVELTQPVEANAVFAVLPAQVTQRLQQEWSFYTWDHVSGEVRLMCAWDTTDDDIRTFVSAVETEMGLVTKS
jgi:threonine aldolase